MGDDQPCGLPCHVVATRLTNLVQNRDKSISSGDPNDTPTMHLIIIVLEKNFYEFNQTSSRDHVNLQKWWDTESAA